MKLTIYSLNANHIELVARCNNILAINFLRSLLYFISCAALFCTLYSYPIAWQISANIASRLPKPFICLYSPSFLYQSISGAV